MSVMNGLQAPAQVAPPAAGNSSAILAALASMARTSASAPPQTPTPNPPQNPYGIMPPATTPNLPPPAFAALPPVNQSSNAFHQALPVATSLPMNQYSNSVAAPLPFPPQPPPAAAIPATDNALQQQQLLVIKTLAEQGVPPEQWASILEVIKSTTLGNGIGNVQAPAPQPQYSGWPGSNMDVTQNRDQSDNRYRQRSRSPQGAWRGDQQRDSGRNGYGHADHYNERKSPPRMNDYRQRSPPGRRGRSPTPPRRTGSTGPKFIDHDPTMKNGHIKGMKFDDGCVKYKMLTYFC